MKASDGAVESKVLFQVVAMTRVKGSLAMVCNSKCNEKVNVNAPVGDKRTATAGGSCAAQLTKKTKK